MWLKIKIQAVIWKSKSHWKSNYFKIIFKIILIYSLYRSNFDVFCLLASLAIANTRLPHLPITLWVTNTIYIYIYIFFFFFNSNVFVSTQVPQLFRSKWLNFSLSAPREKIRHVDLKSWVTGEIIIRPSKVSNWIMYESIWLSIVESIWLSMLSQFDSQYWTIK